jgi:hypothetical protein
VKGGRSDPKTAALLTSKGGHHFLLKEIFDERERVGCNAAGDQQL